jgi:glutamine amidotransferase
MTVSVVDYGLGNLGSITNMLKRVGAASRRITTPDEVLQSDRVLLPGIGAFDNGMDRLRDQGLFEPLREFAATGRPLFGICLGMQLLLDSSEEGETPGLGVIPGRSARIAEASGVRVPHMGWNHVEPTRSDPLIDGLSDESRFYFVHSYAVVPERDADVLGTTEYGTAFASVIRSGNVMGAQFHPEKSHAFGMTVLGNFAKL